MSGSFGILILKSDLIPRILGVVLIISCFAYLIGTLTVLLVPARAHLISTAALIAGDLGELLIILWLLIKA